MSSNSSGKKLEGFFTGKGFYIVLFLCAAVIGVSAWLMATGNGTMEKTGKTDDLSFESKRVETVVLPPERETLPVLDETEAEPEALPVDAPDESETAEVWRQGDVAELAAPPYIWPVQGELERTHSSEELNYDVTLHDWRTHEGVDITAPLGSSVSASHSGTVQSIAEDELYGTVLTLDHGDGTCSVYANLAATPAVNVGDWVEPGDIIGSVGDTALCEIGQGTHLHFAILSDGQSVDPLNYLPA